MKLLIADDEKIIREGISLLDWEEHGIEIVGTAANGEEAFDMVKEYAPDIVISDIRMPRRDGIWLAEQVYQTAPDTKIIFLTGYNEFEYAQKAISFGVSEYILKPIEEEALYETVEKLKVQIETRRSLSKEREKLAKLLERSRYFLKSWFFNASARKDEDLELFGIPAGHHQFVPCIIRFSQEDNAPDSAMRFLIFNRLTQMLSGSISCAPFFDNEDLIFVFAFPAQTALKMVETEVFSLAEQLRGFLNKMSAPSYTIGIGNPSSGTNELSLSYESALKTFSYNFYLGENQIIYIKDVEPNAGIAGYQTRLLNEYLAAVKVSDETESRRIIDRLFRDMERAGESLYNRQRCCLSLILTISNALYEIGCNPSILFNHTDVWSVVKKSSSSEEIYRLILDVNEVAVYHISETQKKRNAGIIEKVKNIVDQNYADDASLESVASQVYLSPCYLSVIFKKETGMTFKNYLIHTRMERAKKFLTETGMKIYEIAEKVGYADTRYFSELFHRTTGQTPSQYRNKYEEKQN